jgi:hypothetical protein
MNFIVGFEKVAAVSKMLSKVKAFAEKGRAAVSEQAVKKRPQP